LGREDRIVDYEAVIGLEVHAQLKTASKIFCGCSATYGAAHNTQVCFICLGLPGILPALNKRAVEYALMMALATRCHISPESRFARKNYFYPDLPKGYQISQYESAISSSEEVITYLKKLRSILRYLEISDGNMEEGSFRCDANLSLRRKGLGGLGTRTELKNINSFSQVHKAL
jgi:aspartyl-tRNA(Asn)/glutamyl-tRNA(Gln) amidotransferase subunit B